MPERIARKRPAGNAASVKAVKKDFSVAATNWQRQASQFNALICKLMAEKAWPRGPVTDLLGSLADVTEDGTHDSPAGRFTGALHALVLERKAPALAALYPTNDPDQRYRQPTIATLWPVICDALSEHKLSLMTRLQLPVIHNDPARCAAIIAPLTDVCAWINKPLTISEIDAAAGLNLFVDQYSYGNGEQHLGIPDSPVEIDVDWQLSPVPDQRMITLIDRAGCDVHPVNASARLDQIRLLSHLAPEAHQAMARTRAAMRLVADSGTTPVAAAQSLRWLDERLSTTAGTAHLLLDLAPGQTKATIQDKRTLLDDAGSKATDKAPLLWLTMTADKPQDGNVVNLTIWRSGKTSGKKLNLGRADQFAGWVNYKRWRSA